MQKSNSNNSRVKICAIASNEGQYLPQWIYHHVYFGFSGFNIYVNRSTDNTLAILEKLKSYYPCINYRNVDWMDKYFNKNIPFALLQRGSYLDDYYNTSIDDFDYIMYIDIDEFYLPINFTDQISDCVWKLGNPDCIYFNWYMIDGVNEYIMPLFANKFFMVNINHIPNMLCALVLNQTEQIFTIQLSHM